MIMRMMNSQTYCRVAENWTSRLVSILKVNLNKNKEGIWGKGRDVGEIDGRGKREKLLTEIDLVIYMAISIHVTPLYYGIMCGSGTELIIECCHYEATRNKTK
jgi:hypothetical protein